jgi:thioredoxin 1
MECRTRNEQMMRLKTRLFIIALALSLCLPLALSCQQATPPSAPDLASIPLEQALSSGLPTLAEFGWRTCIPCKEMKPILEELAVEYQGKLNVVIVEVYEHEDQTRQYEIMVIPTQIVFDSKGNEVIRHIGLWPKEDIITQLKKMGVN